MPAPSAAHLGQGDRQQPGTVARDEPRSQTERRRPGRCHQPCTSSSARQQGRKVPGDEPHGWSERRSQAVQPRAGGGRVEGRHTLGQQRADDAAEHVARAGGGQPGVTGRHDAHDGPTGPPPPSSAPSAARRRPRRRPGPGGPDPVGCGAVAGEVLVLTVVGREHGRRRPGRAGRSRRRVRGRTRPSPSTTAGRSAAPRQRVHPLRVASERPRPGPITSASKRAASPRTTSAQPRPGRAIPTASTGRPRSSSSPGEPTRTIPAPAR